MNEDEWLASIDPTAMLAHLTGSGRASPRKVRLFAVACCRRILDASREPEALRALEAAELYADGLISPAALARRSAKAFREGFQRGIRSSAAELRTGPNVLSAAFTASSSEDRGAYRLAYNDVVRLVADGAGPLGSDAWRRARSDEQRAQARLLRDLFGNPFRPPGDGPPAMPPGSPAYEVARGIYDDHAFDRLPFLGDALEDAGLAGAALAHCRSDAEHARGCWVVDAVLGRN